MSRLLRALTVLALLAAAVALVALTSQYPGKVTVTYGTFSAETGLAVAAAVLALLLGIAFYLGQLLTWLRRLPRTIRDMASGRHKQSTLQALAEGYAAQFLGLTREANRAVSRTNPTASEQTLVNLLGIRLGTTPAATLSRWQADALLGAPASLELARRAVLAADWPAVKATTAAGLAQSPHSPRLLFLHLKALLNTGETAAAADLFPSLRPHVSSSVAKKLEIILNCSLNPDANTAGLKSSWYTAFQQWLTNASEQLPDG
ncbi:MAG TPA: heme biosynthesis HemY N-terminal domain-containing protein [Alphaproteobacteria bacterium]|nr:heme biosynthesis HemY N-terminal domain-containing protein [Alphaproteobacteria bacterium]